MTTETTNDQTKPLTLEAEALLRECFENNGRIRNTLNQEHSQAHVFELVALGLLRWSFPDGWHLTPGGQLLAQVNSYWGYWRAPQKNDQ